MELPGDLASPAPEAEPHGQAQERRSPPEAELYENAAVESTTSSASPVALRQGVAAGDASPSSSRPASRSPPRGDQLSAAEEVVSYDSPSASGHAEVSAGEESPSVSGLREEPGGSVDTGSASPSEQRARGAAVEQGNSMAPVSAAGSPAREEPEFRVPLASSSPAQSGTSTSSSPLAQIKQQARHMRSSSFQRFRQQMQRAWKWGPVGGGGGAERSPREQLLRTTVNIEAMTNQKRQWYQVHSKSRNHKQFKEPASLFEHFFVVGLHSYANVAVIEDAFAKKKAWESNVGRSEVVDLGKIQYHGPIPTMEPQILFKYPPGRGVEIRESDLPSFCFPEGVKARLIERTPSMSDLNEMIFGQEHLCRDDLSFIFSQKVSDNAPLYGVCLHVHEIVQRAPGILGVVSPLSSTSHKPSRFLVSAPRCYCLLTRVPFFELHYEMLNSIVAQERLDRITQFASEIALTEPVPRSMKEQDQNDLVNGDLESSSEFTYNDWTEYAVPVNSVAGLVSSPGLPSERDIPSYLFRSWEPNSPESISASETSDSSYAKELEKEASRSFQQYDDSMSESVESRCDSFGRVSCISENGHTSPDLLSINSPISRRLERTQSMEFLHSSVKGSAGSDEEEEELKNESIVDDEKVMGWAKAHNNEALQIVCGFHALSVPPHGGELVFHPIEHLQPVKYSRPGLSLLGIGDSISDNISTSARTNEVNANLAAAEEAFSLSLWTIATVCRALSLESLLALFAGVLLEKQIVVICPNLGVLSAIVLSVIPMIRPFQWQSLLLPVLPRKLVDFLDAPVPFIAGVQHKPPDIKMKASSLVRVNVEKDQVKAYSLPQLPRYRQLVSDLSPIHASLSCENSMAKRHPIYKCSEVQAEASWQFLNVMRAYLESFCSDLRSHTITNVQSDNDRVSLLLKDSFIDSFPSKDRPFITHFVETQMFSVLSDSRLSTFENEQTI